MKKFIFSIFCINCLLSTTLGQNNFMLTPKSNAGYTNRLKETSPFRCNSDTTIDWYKLQTEYINCGTNFTSTPSLTEAKILQARLPSYNFSGLPQHCLNKIKNQIENFVKEDLRNLQFINNQACSYYNGWLEYIPGTCQAGGPPPLCPVNHWYQNFLKAGKQYDSIIKALRNQRFEIIKQIACDCWSEDIINNEKFINEKSIHELMENSPENKQTVLCTCSGFGDCPPGYKCLNGFCVLQNSTDVSISNYESQIMNLISEKGEDKFIDFCLESLSGTIPFIKNMVVLLKNPAADIILKGFDCKAIATEKDIYLGTLIKFQEDFDQIRSNFKFYRYSKPENEQYNYSQLMKAGEELQKDLNVFTISYNGMFVENDFSQYECSNLISAQYKTVNDMGLRILYYLNCLGKPVLGK